MPDYTLTEAAAIDAERCVRDDGWCITHEVIMGIPDRCRSYPEVTDVAADLLAKLRRVEAALADHPECDLYPDDEPATCGWKRAVASVQWAINGEEVTTDD